MTAKMVCALMLPAGRQFLLLSRLAHAIPLDRAPQTFLELIEIEGISPAPYVGRYKWVTLANSNVLPATELEALIRQSYTLVAAKAPKKKKAPRRASKKHKKTTRRGTKRKKQ